LPPGSVRPIPAHISGVRRRERMRLEEPNRSRIERTAVTATRTVPAVTRVSRVTAAAEEAAAEAAAVEAAAEVEAEEGAAEVEKSG
jgi:hypothetical protein